MKNLSWIFLLIMFMIITLEMPAQGKGPGSYNTEQAISERAQLHTIAFDGLAFLTGNFGADCFFPPGKVADLFGFQFMRDNDSNQLGHNTDFLTRIAMAVMNILDKEQMDSLITLAREQEQLYDEFARKRIILIRAFRKSLEENIPISKDEVRKFCGELYAIDASLCYRRAEVMAWVIDHFSAGQRLEFSKLRFTNSSSWPETNEKPHQPGLSHRAHVGLMTYASELFSWYKGNTEADVYFCPERHGTYFGGFYLKDLPAMGNKGYSISTSLTGESGKTFLDLLDQGQRKLITAIPNDQKNGLDSIVFIRRKAADLLRKFISGEHPDREAFMRLMVEYGKKDGELSYNYFSAFSAINKTLTTEQRSKLRALRNSDILPTGAFIYSDPISLPASLDTIRFFIDPVKKAF